MHFHFVRDSDKGPGDDRATSGARYAIVCDGLGGRGAEMHRHADGRVWKEARVSSNVTCATCEEVVRERLDVWTRACDEPGFGEEVATLLKKRVLEALLKEVEQWSFVSGDPSRVKKFPSTLAMIVTFPDSGKALVLWAGDSRCYLLDDERFCQLTEDDVDESQRMDAMEEHLLGDSPKMSNCVGLDEDFTIHHRLVPLPRRALLLCATDGVYHVFLSPMHEEQRFRLCFQLSSLEEMSDKLREWIGNRADDDVSIAAIYVGEAGDGFDALKAMLLSGYAALKETYCVPFPEPPSAEGYIEIDDLRVRVADTLCASPAFQDAMRRLMCDMENGALEPDDSFPLAKAVRNWRDATTRAASVADRRNSVDAALAEALDQRERVVAEFRSWAAEVTPTRVRNQAAPVLVPTDAEKDAGYILHFLDNMGGVIDDLENCDKQYKRCRREMQQDERRFGFVHQERALELNAWLTNQQGSFNRLLELRKETPRVTSAFNRLTRWYHERLIARQQPPVSCGKLSAVEIASLQRALLNDAPLPLDFLLSPQDSFSLANILSGLHRQNERIARLQRVLDDLPTPPDRRPSESPLSRLEMDALAKSYIARTLAGDAYFPLPPSLEALSADIELLRAAPEINAKINKRFEDHRADVMRLWLPYKRTYEAFLREG